MLADIAFSSRAQYRVADGVNEAIPVRMTGRPHGKRYLDPAKDESSTLDKTMRIETESYSHVGLYPFFKRKSERNGVADFRHA